MAENGRDHLETATEVADAFPAGPNDQGAITPIELFRLLMFGKRTILKATLVVFAVATAVAFLLPVRYTSTASFIPPALGSGGSMAAGIAGGLSALGTGDLLGSARNPGDLYAGILKSQSIASELVKRFNLMELYRVKKLSQAEKMLASDTVVNTDIRSTIVTVEVTAKNPNLAHDLANAYMDALRETNGRLALSQSSQRRLFFGQQLAKEKDDLEEAEVDLKRTEEQTGLIAPTGQTEAEIRTIAETQAQVAEREVQLAALRDSATEQNPELVRLRSEIEDLHAQLDRLQKGSGKMSLESIPTSRVPELQLEYVRKEREVKYHEALFDMLSRQYEAARLDESRDAPVLQLLDPPSYPDSKSSPKRALIMVGGLVLGILGGSVWILMRDHIRTTS
jgi:uncharacterized protein involved in exopolysaccharide biosynthesis